ncbi:MAG: EipA family protein [Hyphomicrobiaceae bacterium]
MKFAVGVLAGLTLNGAVASAQACKPEDFGAAVDSAGASLRTYNLEAAPRLQARMKVLAAKKGWSEQDAEDSAIMYLQDDRISKLDETANSLLARIDTLGRLEPGQPVDCAKLEELKTAGIELLAVMKAKSTYLVSKIDADVATKPFAPAVALSAAPPKDAQPANDAGKPASPARPDERAAATVAKAPPIAPPSKRPMATPSWDTSTDQAAPKPGPPAPIPADVAMLPVSPQPNPNVLRPSAPMVPTVPLEPDDGYTIDEIRDATRGFFGTVSTSLASVIEHAFKNTGRPTGYILGQEGGGAFLGGLRYGDGTLYVRTGGTQKIYWHGPSVGFDVGAAGARTMFLVYKMRQPSDLFRVFTGLDGSAFVVGGVGLTLLGGGGMVLAPIRSGIGMRVGANIGYLRFTPTQTWNPF